KESQEDFLGDSSLHTQVAIVFGDKVLECVLNLCQSNCDFLEGLLSQVSKICNSNAFWENTVGNLCGTITPEMKELAQAMAWNLFFTVFNHSCSLEEGGRNKTLRMKTN
uniref:Uncharacterized protein n=1 Tax=Melopsittacus undulatus TaxID=13146 RepID=A0A8C6JN03_MELUD